MTRAPTQIYKNRLVIVTGLSGAGLSSALKILEDMGYEAFDNFPLSLIPSLVSESPDLSRSIAVSVDSRSRALDPQALLDMLGDIQAQKGWKIETVFLTANPSVLQKRYTETRRPHPMARDRNIAEGIKAEQSLMSMLHNCADHIIDTTAFNIHDLRRHMGGLFRMQDQKSLRVNVASFSYKNGLPQEADMVMDVRFLKNPHWDEALRPLNGLDEAVAARISEDPHYRNFASAFHRMMEHLLPLYRDEGKSYLTIAFGCSGGRHRSVFVAEQIGAWLREHGLAVSVQHRDLK